jgi:hypothetical protein
MQGERPRATVGAQCRPPATPACVHLVRFPCMSLLWTCASRTPPMRQTPQDYFQYATHEGLGVGGKGSFAFWLDNELREGAPLNVKLERKTTGRPTAVAQACNKGAPASKAPRGGASNTVSLGLGISP